MYLRIRVKTKFRELHFRGRSTLFKIGEFYLAIHGWQLQKAKDRKPKWNRAKIITECKRQNINMELRQDNCRMQKTESQHGIKAR